MKVLVFTAQGNYARFRCSYTTTSALTYSIMHPIAVKGLIGAIMGVDYSKLYEYTKDMKIAVQVLRPVYKDTQSFNLIPQSGGNGAANFQSRVEFLRDVKYRFFISDSEEKLKDIAEVLKSREFQFTPYLGASEHIAKLEYEALEDVCLLEGYSEEDVHTAVPKESIIRNDDEYFNINIDRIPVMNDKTREYIKYSSVAFSYERSLKISNLPIYKVGDYNVFFL